MLARIAHHTRLLRSGIVLAGLVAAAASPMAADLSTSMEPLPLRVQPTVTISGDVIRLGDLFTGDVAKADKIVAEAPQPGQRIVLSADWLAGVARSNGVNWKPTSPYDRATVFRPGQVVSNADVIAALKNALSVQGMPHNYGIKLSAPLSALAVAVDVEKTISVRETLFDAAAGTFSAVIELPGTPNARFIPVNGVAYAVIAVPALKQAVPRNTVISMQMIDVTEMPESQVDADTILDAGAVIGKATRSYMKSGQSFRPNDVNHVSMVKVPVLKADMRRGNKITESMVEWIEFNAGDLPADAILDAEQMIGSAPKRMLASGAPVRLADIQALNMIDVPVAARDIHRGAKLGPEDVRWTSVDSSGVGDDIVRTEDGLLGLIVSGNVRAGQTFRAVNVNRPVVIGKGKLVNLVLSTRALKLTAKAKVLEEGAVGQIIRVVNTKSNSTLFAEVVDGETVRVTDQQNAMN